MWIDLLRTSRVQASLALTGVMVLACSVAYGAYLGAEDHDRVHSTLALAERQFELTRDLDAALMGGGASALRSHIGAAGANLAALTAAAEADNVGHNMALRARLAAIQTSWATLGPELSELAAAPPLASRERAARALAPRLDDLLSELDALARGYRQHMADDVRLNAGRQALTLAATAPLLAWALFAVTKGATPGAAGRPGAEPEAVLDERRRLAADLHDNLAQTLSTLNLRAERARARLESRESDGAISEIEGIRSASLEAYSHVRAVMSGLSAPPRSAPSLAQELQQYAADFRQLAGIEVELTLDERAAESVPPSAQPQALNIAREAMANARRHAQASKVSVALWQEADCVWLTVSDNGVGFDPCGERGGEHLGLSIMRARAERIGGELRISSRPGQGTAVMARLPVLEQAGAPAEPFAARVSRAPRRAWY